MPGLPDTFAGSVLDFITNRGVGATYLTLLTTDPGSDATMATISEVVDSGFARQLLGYSVPALSPRATSSTGLLTFGPFPAAMALGATYGAIVEALTGTTGKVRYVWMLDTVVQAAIGESVQFPISSLTLGW